MSINEDLQKIFSDIIKNENSARNLYHLFLDIQSIIDDDENLSRSGNLKKNFADDLGLKLIDLFENDILVLKNEINQIQEQNIKENKDLTKDEQHHVNSD